MESFRRWASDGMKKRCYDFQEGSQNDQMSLGLKGATLCMLTRGGIRVPAGFVVTTETCIDFFRGNQFMPAHLIDSCRSHIATIEKKAGRTFCITPSSPPDTLPLLLAIRAGSAVDMPGMMDSVLNLGMTTEACRRIATITGDKRFALDLHRRFLQQYGTVVLKIPKEMYVNILEEAKAHDGASKECDLTEEALSRVVDRFASLGMAPEDPMEQLREALEAIFCSWYAPRAVKFRRIHHIAEGLGTAVVVQRMVHGTKSKSSCTGKIYTRDPNTGSRHIYGEFVCMAEGCDVADGIDGDPGKIELGGREMERSLPGVYGKLTSIAVNLEELFGRPQEVKFAVEDGELFILDSSSARLCPEAAVAVVVDMARHQQITEREAIMRVDASQMSFFLNPTIEEGAAEMTDDILGVGVQSTAGAVTGFAVFSEEDAAGFRKSGKDPILVRRESSAEDVAGIAVSVGVLTMHGGITSAGAEIARSMDKTVITGAAECGMTLDEEAECVLDSAGEVCIVKGQEITLDGRTGRVIKGRAPCAPAGTTADFKTLMRWSDKHRRTSVYATVESIKDAERAMQLRPDGVGICRTEMMLLNGECEDLMQKYFDASPEEKSNILLQLESRHGRDIEAVVDAVQGRTVSVGVRLFDGMKFCSVHHDDGSGGHKGAPTIFPPPEFVTMQTRAILSAGMNAAREGRHVAMQLIVPVVVGEAELQEVCGVIMSTAMELFRSASQRVSFKIGAMIETPRACLRADKIARTKGVSFILFECERLTELVLGLSRTNTSDMLRALSDLNVVQTDPYRALDIDGVGAILASGVRLVRNYSDNMPIGVSGNQCGHMGTIEHLFKLQIDYISCYLRDIPSVKLKCAQLCISGKSDVLSILEDLPVSHAY